MAELRPTEGGRTSIRRSGLDNQPVDILPAPWNARTRVHEYGGGAWTVTESGKLVFSEFSDQRVYILEGVTPRALTPEPASPAAWRYADLQIVNGEVWAVREAHAEDGAITRDICAIPLDGSGNIRSIVGGSDFLSSPSFRRVEPRSPGSHGTIRKCLGRYRTAGSSTRRRRRSGVFRADRRT